MPTIKAKAIENRITHMAGKSRETAEQEHICVWCRAPLAPFRNTRSAREHVISGMCQRCQDETFGAD